MLLNSLYGQDDLVGVNMIDLKIEYIDQIESGRSEIKKRFGRCRLGKNSNQKHFFFKYFKDLN